MAITRHRPRSQQKNCSPAFTPHLHICVPKAPMPVFSTKYRQSWALWILPEFFFYSNLNFLVKTQPQLYRVKNSHQFQPIASVLIVEVLPADSTQNAGSADAFHSIHRPGRPEIDDGGRSCAAACCRIYAHW